MAHLSDFCFNVAGFGPLFLCPNSGWVSLLQLLVAGAEVLMPANQWLIIRTIAFKVGIHINKFKTQPWAMISWTLCPDGRARNVCGNACLIG